MDKSVAKNSLLLLITACIWGIAFVAQSAGMDYVGPYTFNAARFFLGALVLLPVIAWRGRRGAQTARPTAGRKTLLWGGLLCGVILFGGATFQQIGIQHTSVGKAGFITACYIILVPIFGMALKKPCPPRVIVAVGLCVAGLYLLCINGAFSIGLGDGLVMICAVLFALHILVIDVFSPQVDGVKLSCIQFFVAGLCSAVAMLFTEKPSMGAIMQAWLPIGFAGIFSCGVAYTLQIIGQKGMNPTIASLILSLESCISVIAAWIILGQRLTLREMAGCVIMFAAILLAQMPLERWKRKKA